MLIRKLASRFLDAVFHLIRAPSHILYLLGSFTDTRVYTTLKIIEVNGWTYGLSDRSDKVDIRAVRTRSLAGSSNSSIVPHFDTLEVRSAMVVRPKR